MPYRTTQEADADLVAIYLWGCREFGRQPAEPYHQGLAATFDLITAHPRMARERPEFKPPVRCHPYRSHLIVYMLDDDGVLIVRVPHGRREWEACLTTIAP